LEKLFSRLCRDNITFFISGDFNINLTSTKKNKQVKLYADRLVKLLELYNLKPTIKSPSRQTRKTATLIDNIFANSADDMLCAYSKDPGFSDHFSQSIETKVLAL